MKRIFTMMMLLVAIASGAWAQVQPYAVYKDNTLTFYYDNQSASRDGIKFEGGSELFKTVGWESPGYIYEYKSLIEKVVFDDSMADYQVPGICNLFNNCTELTTIEGVDNLNVGMAYRAQYAFYKCSKLETLDLSTWSTSNITDMYGMFQDCTLLKTIIVGDNWSVAKVSANTQMFEGCTSLVGGNGTPYDANHTDNEYARIDKEGQPGYFTAIAPSVQPYDLWVGGVQVTSANATDITAAINAVAANTASGTATYNSETKTLTLDNFSYNGTGYLYQSNACAAIHGVTGNSDPLTICIEGTNNITYSTTQRIGAGIHTGDGTSLNFTGSGILNIKSGTTVSTAGLTYSYGINVGEGNLELTESFTGAINVETASSDIYGSWSIGLRCPWGEVSIRGGSLTTAAGKSTYSYGISSKKNICFYTNSVIATGHTAAHTGSSSGISAWSSTSIDGSNLVPYVEADNASYKYFTTKAPAPTVVGITVEPTSGDIAEAVAAEAKKVTDAGNIVGNITVNLSESGTYTVGSSITASKNIEINGNGATVDASGLTGNMIEMAVVESPTDWTKADVTIKDLTVTGLQKALFYSAGKNYVAENFTIDNCVVELAADATTIDYTKGSTALNVTVTNSTFYAPTATTKAFYSSQSGQKATEYDAAATQTFTFKNNTMYNLAKTKNFFAHRQNGQKWLIFDIEQNIFVDCGKSGQVLQGLNGGQRSANPVYTVTGNLFNFDGADTSASESTADETEPVQDSVEGIITFNYPTVPDFSGSVLLAPSVTAPSALGDPRWTLTYANALAITIADSEGGSVTASPGAAAEGATITLTATPAEGYELASITVKDASENEVTVNDDNTFTMPATDVTVTATFTKLPVDVNITIESGKDIAAEVEAAADGAPIKSITVDLEAEGTYTISKSLSAQGNVIINGNGATIDASSLSEPVITLSGGTTFALKGDGTESDHVLVENVTVKDVTITGQQGALLRDAQKSLVETVTIENSVVEMPAAGKNVLDFNGKGYAGKVIVKNSTIWSAGKNTGFFAQYGSRPKNVNGDLLQEFDVENSTIVNIANGKNFCDLKQNGTAQNVYTIKNNIFSDCGKAGQVVVGFNKGQTSATPVWDVDGNTFLLNGADNSAAEISKAGQKDGEDIVKNCLTSDPEFADATTGDFTVGESTEQAELETGDPRWLVPYAAGEGDATALLAEIEEAKKLLKYSMSYYDEHNAESPETEGKALVDVIRDATEQAESATSQTKIDNALEALKQAEVDYADAEVESELDESEAILAIADPDDELAAELQRLYDTQDVVRANNWNQPKNIKNYADRLDKAQKAYLRNALNSLIPVAQAAADGNAGLQKAIDDAKKALGGDRSEELFEALQNLLAAMNTATGISSLEAIGADNAPVYNLNGQRVSKNVKGIVIKNGKKYSRK